MSVSFSPTYRDDVPHTLECSCGNWFSGDVFPSRALAFPVAAETTPGCGDPYCDRVYATPVEREPEVNVSNTYADEILNYLGILVGEDFSDRCVGSLPAEDFLSRVLVAEALCPQDSGLVTMQIENHVYCGRPSDYLQTRFSQLREVAEWSIANQRSVTWG